MSHNQSTLQGMTIKEHEKNKRVLEMRIIKMQQEIKLLKYEANLKDELILKLEQEAMSLKEWQKYKMEE